VSEFAANHVTDLSQDSFENCLGMLLEQLSSLLRCAVQVDDFCLSQGYSFVNNDSSSSSTPMGKVVTSAAELCSKSIAELLRLRKEAHSLISLEEMKRIWDVCQAFCVSIESQCHCKASTLASTLLAQAKAFCERQHESNMSALVAALDSERWVQCQFGLCDCLLWAPDRVGTNAFMGKASQQCRQTTNIGIAAIE